MGELLVTEDKLLGFNSSVKNGANNWNLFLSE